MSMKIEELEKALKTAVAFAGFASRGDDPRGAQNVVAKLLRDAADQIEREGIERAAIKKRGRQTRPVICIETGERFESANKACNRFGLNPSNMSGHLNGRLKTIGGYTFKYVDSLVTSM